MNLVQGLVSLIGAGPGDPGLLTVKALQRLREADLIIYDTLANPEHLKHAKPGARSHCVGPGFRYKKLSQEKINRLILQEAKKGKHVLRLKGGDPYLFGRGGEEALFLVAHKIPFEVIPGVTSATGCAAYAGIPLTHRDHNASVTFLTGHRAHDKDLDTIDWNKIASLKGALAVYMGFYNLEKIAVHLLSGGMSRRTPVAVVEWGTLPRQRSCEGTLADIARRVRDAGLKAPCMIFIGDVVRLRTQLNWFERLPLFSKKVVITRMREKADTFAEKFRQLGARVIEFPVIEIVKKADTVSLDRALRSLSDYDWLCFTSAYGVQAFFERLQALGKDARALGGLKIACVGPQTNNALQNYGVKADLQPARFETSALAQEFKKKGLGRGKLFLLPRADIAPNELEKALQKCGARTHRVAVYQTRPTRIPKGKVKELLRLEPDFVTFTSASTVDHFVRAVGLQNVRRLGKKTIFASIGPVTSRALKKYGLKTRCQARTFDTEGLVAAVQRTAAVRR